jgi:PKD repeat protein
VIQWNWNFNDIGSGQNNFSTLKNPTHIYSSAGPRNVSLRAITDKGCENTQVINIAFGEKPLANFTFETECYVRDSAIQFIDTSVSRSAIESYIWKFHDKGNVTIRNEENPEYVFSGIAEHQVELTAITEFGCRDTVRKEVFLRPTFSLSDGPYFQDFEVGQGFWISEKQQNAQVNNWQFSPLTDNFGDTETSNTTWFTNLEIREQEQSWVSSPCFNFENVEQPYIQLDIWRFFEQNRDGAVLQWTENNGQTWTNIGSIDDGINWYNSFAVPSLPGGIGWTNRIDNDWVESRHRLDSLVGKKNVQFRIFYGSDGTGITNEGVAFDDIWISTRSKKVLVEHFTNVGDSLHNASNEIIRELNKLNPQDMVSIQYHLPGPGIDSFYLSNPVGPNTRLIKYGLSGGPISIVNGSSNEFYQYTDENDQPENNDLIKSSLIDAIFSIDLTTNVVNSSMEIETEVKALENVTNREFILLLAAVQDVAYHYVNGERKTYYNVFRDFIPNGAGLTYLGDWARNDARFESFQYEIDNDLDPENLSIIAFLQDERSNEILQVATDQDSLVTGIYLPKIQSLDFLIYPNPATDMIRLKLEKSLDANEKLTIDIVDYTGKTVFIKAMKQHDNHLSIPVSSIPPGLYMVRVIGAKFMGIQKLIISE